MKVLLNSAGLQFSSLQTAVNALKDKTEAGRTGQNTADNPTSVSVLCKN